MLSWTTIGARNPLRCAILAAYGFALAYAVAASAEQPEGDVAAQQAPERVIYAGTRTMLGGNAHELAGVIASSDPRYARAIFVGPNNRQAVYGVGDEVAPGMVIDTIERDYVVLSRGGRPEALALRRSAVPPGDVKLARLSPDSNSGAIANTGYDPVEERMARLRASISAEPPPLPPVSAVPLDIRRGKNSGKLPAAVSNRL